MACATAELVDRDRSAGGADHAGEHGFEGGLVGADEALGVGRPWPGSPRNPSSMAPGAGGRWLLHTIVGSSARMPVEGAGEHAAVDLVHPRRVDGRPADLPGSQHVAVEVGGRLGDRGQEGAEAVGAEQDAGAVVDEAGGDRVVVDAAASRR